MRHCKSNAKGKVHSNTGLPQETRKKSNNLTPHLKQLEKEEMKKPRFGRRKEILKIRAEINAKETKETIAKINKAKSWFFERIFSRYIVSPLHMNQFSLFISSTKLA